MPVATFVLWRISLFNLSRLFDVLIDCWCDSRLSNTATPSDPCLEDRPAVISKVLPVHSAKQRPLTSRAFGVDPSGDRGAPRHLGSAHFRVLDLFMEGRGLNEMIDLATRKKAALAKQRARRSEVEG